MNSKIYGKLAVTNLKNNGKGYIPYVLASAFSVMMYFIMDSLYRNPSLVKTGATLSIMLSYGLSDFFFAHSDFLHNLVAFSIIVTFRYLFVVDDKHSRHEEDDSEKYADEEKSSVEVIKVFPA